MPLFNVTHQPSGRTLHIRAACRTCARRIAVEHIAVTGATAEWRDPEQTRVDFVGSGNGPSGVLQDSAVCSTCSGSGRYYPATGSNDTIPCPTCEALAK